MEIVIVVVGIAVLALLVWLNARKDSDSRNGKL